MSAAANYANIISVHLTVVLCFEVVLLFDDILFESYQIQSLFYFDFLLHAGHCSI